MRTGKSNMTEEFNPQLSLLYFKFFHISQLLSYHNSQGLRLLYIVTKL